MDHATQSRLRSWAWFTASAHLLLGCAWPLLGRRSHAAVMGPKHDQWLMDGIALMFGVTGSSIARAAATNRITPEIAQIAIGSSAAMVGLETVNLARRRIRPVHLVDLLGHVSIVAGWGAALLSRSRP